MNDKKICKYCRTEIDKKAKICPNCKKKQSSTIGNIIAVLILIFIIIPMMKGCFAAMTRDSSTTSNNSTIQSERKSSEVAPQENATEETVEETDTIDESYESNQYFDIVEQAMYTNSIGDTVVIDKVLAKQSADIESTIIINDAEGNVIGKDSETITLTEGAYNFFEYHFDGDVTSDTFNITLRKTNTYLKKGEPNGAELTAYNQSENTLYLTFKQNCDDLGAAQYKILFYKGDQIVRADSGHFMINAKNLTGKDTTDVVEMLVYGVDYDRIEYIYQQ